VYAYGIGMNIEIEQRLILRSVLVLVLVALHWSVLCVVCCCRTIIQLHINMLCAQNYFPISNTSALAYR